MRRIEDGTQWLLPSPRYAATAILLPSMHMLGNLRPSHAPAVLDHLDMLAAGGRTSGDIDTISLEAEDISTTLNISGEGKEDKAAAGQSMWSHFRGCFGKTEEEQQALWAEAAAENAGSQAQPVSAGEAPFAGVQAEATDAPYIKPGRSVQLKFVRHAGTPEEETTEVTGRIGETLMDVAKRESLEPIEGVCGGHLGESTFCLKPSAPAQPSSQSAPHVTFTCRRVRRKVISLTRRKTCSVMRSSTKRIKAA